MNIALVFGGRSVEHDVSVVTAKQIYSMCGSEHNIYLIYVTNDGKITWYKNKEFKLETFKNEPKTEVVFNDGYLYKRTLFGLSKVVKIHCALMCTHGGEGEDGTIVSYFLTNKIPTTAGSGVALGISMNKWLTKEFLISQNIKTVEGFLCTTNDEEFVHNQIIKSIGYPVILKPNSGGSSIGIEIVEEKESLKNALDIALKFDSEVIIEKAISNFVEYNCAVLGDCNYNEISQIDEPVKKEQILTFTDKYLSGDKNKKMGMKGQNRSFPILPARLQKEIKTISKLVFEKLGLYGVVRIDYIYEKKSKQLYVNEINAIPGSLASYFFINNDFTKTDFIEKLINIGISKYQNNVNIDKNFITKLF